MKTTIALISLIAAVSVLPVAAADQAKETIDVRLAEVDLAVTLKQYEKVRLMQLEVELQAALSAGPSKEDRESMEKRMIVLREEALRLRESAHRYDATLRKNRETASAITRPRAEAPREAR